MAVDPALQPCNEVCKAEVKGAHPGPQFDYIHASRPGFGFADKRLMNCEARSQGLLRQAGGQPGFTKLDEKVTVLGRVRERLHARHRGNSFQPKIEYANIG
jgi:hypothetical protein